MRRLLPWGKVLGVISSTIMLLNVPCGTILGLYFLTLFLSPKGNVVFSQRYREVIEQTPHVRYKTSPVVWFFVGLLILVLVLVFALAFLG